MILNRVPLRGYLKTKNKLTVEHSYEITLWRRLVKLALPTWLQ